MEDKLKITFHEPQFAITKGQSVVLYDEDRLLGGGIISKITQGDGSFVL
jgi:tRNA-specific 2-thiouridylase